MEFHFQGMLDLVARIEELRVHAVLHSNPRRIGRKCTCAHYIEAIADLATHGIDALDNRQETAP
jgi:hypothetical protein